MINKHELLGFECLESRHTFAVEDVALIEFTTTDGRSGHFWYDSHVDPSPYDGLKEESFIDQPPPGGANGSGGVFGVETDVGFTFNGVELNNPGIGVSHYMTFDYNTWKTVLESRSIVFVGRMPESDYEWHFSFESRESQYMTDMIGEQVFPDSLLSPEYTIQFGSSSTRSGGMSGNALRTVDLATIREVPALDLFLESTSSESQVNLLINASVDSRISENDFQPGDDLMFYWSSNETTAGIISEVPSEIFGQSAATRYSTTFSASIDSIQTLIPSNANSIIAIIDNNDNILEKNEFNNVLAVPLSDFLVDDGSVQLSYDSLGRLYADGQAVSIQNQYAASAIGGFEVVSATDEGGNQLIVERDNTQYRLIADDVWRINGLFNSLQNESASILDVSARESPSTLNISAVAGAYEINGVNNPTLIVRRGQTYRFNLNTAGHPFYLQTTGSGYQSANVYDSEFTGNSQTTGEHQWVVPEDAPEEIFYQCEFHPVMFGKIIVVD